MVFVSSVFHRMLTEDKGTKNNPSIQAIPPKIGVNIC